MSFYVGQAVVFGRGNGEQTKGVVMKVNAKSVKVRQTEARGNHFAGEVWTVSPALIRSADGVPVAPPASKPVKDGLDWNRDCVSCGLKPEDFGAVVTLQGTQFRLVGLNPSRPKNDVEIERVRDGKRFKCSSDAVRYSKTLAVQAALPKVKRTEDQLLNAIQCCYGELSPENLFMDGEISHSQGMRRRREINQRLSTLFQELGRSVSEDEIWTWEQKRFASHKNIV